MQDCVRARRATGPYIQGEELQIDEEEEEEEDEEVGLGEEVVLIRDTGHAEASSQGMGVVAGNMSTIKSQTGGSMSELEEAFPPNPTRPIHNATVACPPPPVTNDVSSMPSALRQPRKNERKGPGSQQKSEKKPRARLAFR